MVSAPQDPEVLAVFQRQSALMGSPLVVVDQPWTESPLALAGGAQRWNAALAVAALRAVTLPVPTDAYVRGLGNVQWPGRFQQVVPGLFLDGAHNPAAARELVATWSERFGSEKACLIFGALEDKDVFCMLQILAPVVREAILVPVQNPRCLDLERLSSMVRETMPAVPVERAEHVSAALQMRSASPRLLTGSLYLVGEALAHLRGEHHHSTLQ